MDGGKFGLQGFGSTGSSRNKTNLLIVNDYLSCTFCYYFRYDKYSIDIVITSMYDYQIEKT